jgi:uncharacterized protein YndB with AHSA1/START domain
MPPLWNRWPDDLGPDRSPVYTCNELEIEATPEAVWAHLIDAEAWPKFYANARDVRVDGAGALLAPGTVFTWKTFGLRVKTRVEVFEPPTALAWRGDQRIGRGMHTWTLEPTGSGCRVVTEEAQGGALPSIGRWYIRGALLRWHQRWLEGLSERTRGAC